MTREEAIEVVKKNWPDSRYTSLREALGFLIPELREKRMIERIIDLIKEVQEDEDWHIGAWSDDAIAWLEKQKSND